MLCLYFWVYKNISIIIDSHYINAISVTFKNLKFGVIIIVVFTEISDTEDWSNDAEIQLCITAINYIWTDIHIETSYFKLQ